MLSPGALGTLTQGITDRARRRGAGRDTHRTNFTQFGSGFVLNNAWQFFRGYRYAIFNYATSSLGGSVTVPRFQLSTP